MKNTVFKNSKLYSRYEIPDTRYNFMAQTCSICGKGSMMGRQYKKLMSKYNPTPFKRKYPNLQWMSKKEGGRILVCTKCLKKAGRKNNF